jgi:hypothetical protein
MRDSRVSAIQAEYILSQEAFRGSAVIYPPQGTPGTPEAEFFYRAGFILTRDRDQRAVLRILDTLGPDFGLRGGEVADNPIPGLTLIKLLFTVDDPARQADVMFRALEIIEQQLGAGTAAPDHLLTLANGPTVVGWCAPTEPDPEPEGTPPQPGVSRSRCDGRGTRVAIVDCGLVQNAPETHWWMRGVTGDPDEQAPVGGPIVPYGGHGTFIASIIRAMAPRAEVHVARVFKHAGAAYESDVVRELLAMLDWTPDVISLSAGTHTWESAGLLSFHVFVDGPLREHHGTVLVAAAGNDGADWKFSPAEMEPVIGVGALGPADARAPFSDYGDWVKVYAAGMYLVQAFGYGPYGYREPPRAESPLEFQGMALWNGTSFSTPIVAGLIAARMSGTGESARAAADFLLQLARAQALPGVGPVLHPGQACLHLCEQPPGRCACRRTCGCEGPES